MKYINIILFLTLFSCSLTKEPKYNTEYYIRYNEGVYKSIIINNNKTFDYKMRLGLKLYKTSGVWKKTNDNKFILNSTITDYNLQKTFEFKVNNDTLEMINKRKLMFQDEIFKIK